GVLGGREAGDVGGLLVVAPAASAAVGPAAGPLVVMPVAEDVHGGAAVVVRGVPDADGGRERPVAVDHDVAPALVGPQVVGGLRECLELLVPPLGDVAEDGGDVLIADVDPLGVRRLDRAPRRAHVR